MSRLDIVIFGATGFTGKQAAIHMVEYAKKHNITGWGIAGRSEKKLQDVLAEVVKKTGADVSSVKTIIADVGDEKSLHEMCAQTKVLVNCCGPYMLYGEPVVKAALDEKTHYVDVSGEPQFMEKMQLRYNDAAREAGVFIVSACGWDSVPADMGVTLLKQNFKGTLNSVESYLSFKVPKEFAEKGKERGLINYGTWQSLVGGLAQYKDLPAVRKQLYPQKLPTFKPKLHRQLLHKRDGKWCLPFLGADESVIYRTQRYLYEIEHQRPIHFKAYFKSGGLLQSLLFIFFGIVLFGMSKFQCTRNLLLNYPRLFSWGAVSKEGPIDEVMENSFFKFKLFGIGWETGADVENTKPEKKVAVEVTGSNPGYGATVVTLLTSACTILKERQKMPAGGVLTPGAAFKDTDMIKNLNETKYIKFQVVEIN